MQGHDDLDENDLVDDYDNHCEVGDIVLADVDKVTEENNHYWHYKNGDMLKIHPEDYYCYKLIASIIPIKKRSLIHDSEADKRKLEEYL